ncbi:MAG: TFIIB-type zinc ribbon-containing protein [Candidatus Poseidoniaceae archaeon]|nr:TFIIB-type zinc ribbon-containing protein [Candidatus Poseidoniaceae archaeon]
MNEKCDECNSEVKEDPETGELLCKDCGLVMNDSVLEQDGGNMLHGDNAQSETAKNSRIKDTELEGTTFIPDDVKGGAARGLWRRLIKHQARGRRGRKVFADDVMEQVKALGLGRDVEIAVKIVVKATLVAQTDEAEFQQNLGKLPLNEIRMVKNAQRTDRERVAAIAAVMTAANFNMIVQCRLTPFISRWGIKRSDCNEMAKRMKARIVRMRALGRINISTCMRPSARRKANLDEAMKKMRCGLVENSSLNETQVRGVISGCVKMLIYLGEPECDSATPNERADMLVASVAKEVSKRLGLTGINTCIANSLELSTGGVCQRHKVLRKLFKNEDDGL